MMASKGSESEPGDVARFFPFVSPLAEGLRGARSPISLDAELWRPMPSELADEKDLAGRCDLWAR